MIERPSTSFIPYPQVIETTHRGERFDLAFRPAAAFFGLDRGNEPGAQEAR